MVHVHVKWAWFRDGTIIKRWAVRICMHACVRVCLGRGVCGSNSNREAVTGRTAVRLLLESVGWGGVGWDGVEWRG